MNRDIIGAISIEFMDSIDYRSKLHQVVRAQERYFAKLNKPQQEYLSFKLRQYTSEGNYLMAHSIVVQSLVAVCEGGVSNFYFPGIYSVQLPEETKPQIVRLEVHSKVSSPILVCDCVTYSKSDNLYSDGGVCPHTEAAKLFSLSENLNEL